jgi:signal transduction histidine kinase
VTRRSLHARLIAGAAIWSAGLLAVAFALAVVSVNRYPDKVLLIHHGLLALTGAVLVTAGVSVIRRGLSPIALLRQRLAAVRDGRTARLEGEYPAEVAPLVADLNTLLEDRERSMARAAARAGDLAHGLKTPLAVLTQEIHRAEAAGQPDLAGAIRQQVDRMRRQIDSHLAQARAAALGRASRVHADVGEVARGLARTMGRLYAGRALALTVDAPDDPRARVPVEDLEEMLGNLLDNACKWARTRVTVSASLDDARVVILVDDDGPGVEASKREQVLQRGVRADETAPGSGLGLAIVRDLAEAYGGVVTLEISPDAGVRARLTLPAVVPETGTRR